MAHETTPLLSTDIAPPNRIWAIFPALALGLALAAADQTIVISTYSAITTDFDALDRASWLSSAYSIALASAQPIWGVLCDNFGRKSCLVLVYSFFGLGCLFSTLAQSMNQLIAARALSGLGGGGMSCVASIIISDLVPDRQRGKWQGYVSISYGVGAGLGAPLGGLAVEHLSWRWPFGIQVILCAGAIFIIKFTYQEPKRNTNDGIIGAIAQIDYLGAILIVTFAYFLLMALDRSNTVAWNDWVTLTYGGLSAFFLLLFCLGERYVVSRPLLPGRIIFRRSLLASYGVMFFSYAGTTAAMFQIPLSLQAVVGIRTSVIGVLIVPSMMAGVLGSLLGGIWIQRSGYYYGTIVAGYGALVLGILAVTISAGIFTEDTKFLAVGALVGMGIGTFSNGSGLGALIVGIIVAAGPDDRAVAISCSFFFRQLGSAFGVAITTVVVNQSLSVNLFRLLGQGKTTEDIIAGVKRNISYLDKLDPSQRAAVRAGYQQSFCNAFLADLIMVTVAASAAVLVKGESLEVNKQDSLEEEQEGR